MSRIAIRYKPQEQVMELKVKLFKDDFEDAISKHSGKIISIQEGEDHGFRKAITGYFDQHLRLYNSAEPMEMSYKMETIEELTVTCVLEVNVTQTVTNVNLFCTLLYDKFDDQVNIVSFDWLGTYKNYYMDTKISRVKLK